MIRRMIRWPVAYIACQTALAIFIGVVGWAFWALFTALVAS
jgi:hypothetical protein